MRVSGHPLGPVEVHIALALLFKEEAFIGGTYLKVSR